jgi:polyisoprenyl-phosphate glycosyltransferase
MRDTVTVAVPTFNEESGLPELIKRLQKSFADIEATGVHISALLIDDGSSDKTLSILKQTQETDRRFGFISLSRNFGHQAAISAALDHVRTDAIIVMDADLQDPPELLVQMVRLWRANEADVIYGQRISREGSLIKRFCYSIFYRIFNYIVDTKIPADAGDFALMDRCVYEKLRDLNERVRFLRGLRSWIGFRQIALPYHRPERFSGAAKYSFVDLYKLATDGIASFSVAPLRVAQFFFLVWTIVALTMLVWVVASRPWREIDPMFALMILVAFSVAMLFMCLHILGAYIARTYMETKHRPMYVPAEFVPGTAARPDDPRHSR